jgi:AcrR family transcriptional regulator
MQSSDTRSRLIAAARQVMAERGVAGCTTKEIARVAGVAEGTIYNQFSDKADLYLSVASDLIPELIRNLETEPGRRHPRALLTKVATETLAAMNELIPVLSGIVGEPDLLNGARARWASRKASGKASSGLTDYFTAEQAAGRIGDRVPPSMLAHMFFGTVFHHAFMGLLLGESQLELRGRRFVEALVDAILAAAGRVEVAERC